MNNTLLIRTARPEDAAHLYRLASLDDARSIDADHALVAELAGDIVAAIDVEEQRPIADPFRPTAAYVELLRMRAEQVADTTVELVGHPAHGTHASAYA